MVAEKAKPPRTEPGSRTGKNARSGPTVPEHKRARKQKVLRLLPAEADQLAQLAARWGLTESEAAARAVAEALARDE